MTLQQRLEELLSQLTLREKVTLLSGQSSMLTMPIERLGIPSLAMTDGPHGVRADREEVGRPTGLTTAFPTGVSMAASWNPELIERVGAALGSETHAMGCDILLAPCVNIVRHPLAGRNFESYSEDPYLAGRIGVAYVKGVQSEGVGTSLKHYACNNQENERMRGSSEVDERTLREIYLSQFETIVKEAKPWTVMCAYNRINGTYASENSYLLQEILRGEWGFEGAVISDWGANHTIVESVKGGLDLEMPGPAKYYGNLLFEAITNWQIDEAFINEAARRMLRLILQSGKLEGKASRPAGAGRVNTPEHQALARELAEEAITLLKNDGNVLPLKAEALHAIAVIGPNAAEDFLISGGGSARVISPYFVSPLEGLKAKLGDRVEVRYAPGCSNYRLPPVIRRDYLTPANGHQGNGLKAEYFNRPVLSEKPDLERLDARPDFWWPNEGPLGQSLYAVRWTGSLIAPGTGRYLLGLANTATARVYLDGKLLVESATDGQDSFKVNVNSGTAELVSGQAYDLRVEFIKNTKDNFSLIRLLFAFDPTPEKDQRLSQATELAAKSDVAIVCVGMPESYESEGIDRPDIELPGAQVELIRAVAKANPKTIVVLNAGAPVSMPWLNEVPVVVNALYPGMEGGAALARILLGEVNPSGKLTTTFPKRLEDTPAFNNYPGQKEVHYGEGIFVGYRHYDLRAVEPLFPFGHGLSYTSFEYSDLKITQPLKRGGAAQVAVTVKNTGTLKGKEVVQLYVSDKQASLPRPPKELKGFAKVALDPGQSTTLKFDLDERAFSFYDPEQKGWVMEPGEFEILVGSSSRDIRVRLVMKVD